MNRRRMLDAAQHRYQAHDRRWRLLLESPDPRPAARRRALDWAGAYVRRLEVIEARVYVHPKVTHVGNLIEQLAHTCAPHDVET